MREPLIYTFYRLSTFFITYAYPVDSNIIKNEIVDPQGKIGPSFYKQYDIDNDSESMGNLVKYNNEWIEKLDDTPLMAFFKVYDKAALKALCREAYILNPTRIKDCSGLRKPMVNANFSRWANCLAVRASFTFGAIALI